VANTRAERVFIIENYFGSESITAVREAFSSAFRDSKLSNYVDWKQYLGAQDVFAMGRTSGLE
jgi:hypothetical protein